MDFNRILNEVFTGISRSASQISKPSESTADSITKIGGGAALVGLLSMVLGKNGGANLTKLGSLAALGSMAYQAYQNYQKSQSAAPLSEQSFNLFDQQNTAGEVVLQTMIAAAAADGIIDEQEKALILQENGDHSELQSWLEQQLHQPMSVNEIAQSVGNNPALASQVYLAARLVCQQVNRKEMIFLAQLAEALHLEESLVAQLEQQAGF